MEQTSIVISNEKKELIYGRLSRRLRKLNLSKFEDYYQILMNGDHAEMENFVNAVTTNLTSFFRENHHFDHLRSVVIPKLLQENAASRKIRIWSAGCSTGEEPYSIAMTLMEAIPNIDQWDVKILATDIDSDVLARAKSGVYKADRIEGLPPHLLRRWMKKGKGIQEGNVRVAPELQQLISFRQLNLLRDWPIRGPFDVLFCRNVVIYFDKPTQKILFEKFSNVLSAHGHMYIGHSETLFKISEDFTLLGQTIYKKCA